MPRWLIFIVVGLITLTALEFEYAHYLQQYEKGNYYKNQQIHSDKNEAVHGPFFVIAKSVTISILDFADRNDKAISALSTFVIAVFTVILAFATMALWIMASKQDETTKMHERAYIVCGGLFGVSRSGVHMPRPKATEYDPPWQMMIYNNGRTSGFVTKIEWGVCPEDKFYKDISVSKIITDKKLSITTVDFQEMFAPTGINPFPYRHVAPDRVVGEVFFGKISYTDVFKKPHHSTFALLHRKEHTDSIGRSFAEDWN